MDKRCFKCDSLKQFLEFGNDKSTRDGYTTCCKLCRKAMLSAWKLRNPGKAEAASKAWVENNIDEVRSKAKAQSANFRGSFESGEYAAIQKTWRSENPHKTKQYTTALRDRIGRAELSRRVREDRKLNPAAYASYDATKRAKRLQRFVRWRDQKAVKNLYLQAEELSRLTGIKHHVDHVIPLQGRLVSGLHVHQNLRVLPAVENMMKGNKFDLGVCNG